VKTKDRILFSCFCNNFWKQKTN